MAQRKIGAIIALDGESKYKQAVTNCSRALNQYKAELELVKAESEGQEDSLDSLGRKHEVLSKILEAQKQKQEEVEKGLNHARESYDEMGDKLVTLRDTLEKATEKMKDMKEEGNASEEELKQQKEQVEQLTNALKKSEENYEKAGNRIQKWETDLTKAKTETAKASNALNENARAMKEVAEESGEAATSLEEVKEAAADGGDGIDLVSLALEKAKNPMAIATAGAAALGTAFTKAAKESVEFASQTDSAMKKFRASTGASATEMKKYKQEIEDLYRDNYGESIEGIAESMAKVKQITGEMDAESLKEITENATALEDVFGMDLQESIRGADTLVKKFGLTNKQAYDLMARGAQNGLNKSEELADNIAEYGPLWQQAGFSAEEMFTVLQNGLDSGAYNLDKVNDFVKEFGISLSDGRIKENISSFSEGTQKLFEEWQEGKATSKDVFYSVVNDLKNATDKQEALTLASNIWSALGEDNAMDVIASLGDVNDAYKDVGGTMESIKDIAYDTLESKLESLGRKAKTEILTPLGEKALPLIEKGIETAGKAVDAIAGKINPQKTVLQEFINEIRESNDQVDTMLDQVDSSMTNAEKDAGKIKIYKDTLLELNDTTKKTEHQKYQIKRIVEELAAEVPELAAAWDEEAGKINLSREAIEEYMKAYQGTEMLQAITEARKEALNAEAEAEVNVAMAKSARTTAEEELAEAMENGQEKNKEGLINYGEYAEKIRGLNKDLKEAKQSEEEAIETRDRARESADAARKSTEELAEQYGFTYDEAGNLIQKTEELKEVQNDATNTITDATVRIAEKYTSMRDTMTESIQSQMDMFSEFKMGTAISTEELLNNMQSQINGVTTWADNMEELARRGINDGLLEHLAELGPQGAEYVQTFVDMTPEQLQKANDLWAQSLDFKTGTAEAVDSAIQTYTEGISGGTEKMQAAMENLGVNSWEGFKEGISQKEEEAKATGVELGEALIKGTAEGTGVHSPSWKTAQQGRYVVEGLTDGIKDHADNASNAAKKMAENVVDTSEKALEKSKFTRMGKTLTSGIREGISAGSPTTEEQIRKLLAEIRALSTTGTAAARYMPYGRTLVIGLRNGIRESSAYPVESLQGIMKNLRKVADNHPDLYNTGLNMSYGLANGISDGQSSVINAVANMCAAAVEQARSSLDIHSPSKVFEQLGRYTAQGFGNGYENEIAGINQMIRDTMVYSGNLTASGRVAKAGEADAAMDILEEFLPYLKVIAEKKYMSYIDSGQALSAMDQGIQNNTALQIMRRRR